MTRKDLLRLIDLDAGLASARGIRLSDYARRWKISHRTARRDLVLLRSIGFGADYDPYSHARTYPPRLHGRVFAIVPPRRRKS